MSDGYQVKAGSQYLEKRGADGFMTWNSESKFATVFTKEKAEWFCAIVKERSFEAASQRTDAEVVPDYYRRQPGDPDPLTIWKREREKRNATL